MAKNPTFPVSSRSQETVLISGSFAPNGSSAVSASSREGCGFTVARASAGLFTLTLSDRFTALVSANATAQLTTAADIKAQIGPVVVGPTATNTVQIRLLAVATETDVAAAAGNRVNFILVLTASNSSRRRGD